MSSQYFTKNITIYFEDHNYGDIPISTTDYLSDVINKAINLTPFDPSLSFVRKTNSQTPTLQEYLFGIIMVGVGNKVIDFIAFKSKKDIVDKSHVRIDDRPRHKWTYGSEVRKIEDIHFHNMKDMHLIVDPSLLLKCFTVIDSHCNMEWLLKYNKVLPPANVKRQYRRGRDIYMRELYRVLHKNSKYNRPSQITVIPQDTPPQVIPQNTPPQNTPPQDTIQNTPPQNTPPQNTPPQNTPPQDIPPQNTSPQNTPQDTPPQDTPQDNNNDLVVSPVINQPKFHILKMMTDSSNIEYGYHSPGKQ